jgi:tryptophan-rich sensory protein
MAVAAWRVWRRGGWQAQRGALALFVSQLVVNFSWSFIFFGAQQIGWALADIFVLCILIAMTMRRLAAIDRLASWLMAPYLAWVTFAAALNAEIYRLQSLASPRPARVLRAPEQPQNRIPARATRAFSHAKV